MMDDEDTHDSGIGTLAAYQLGRWSAESDAELSGVMARLRRARRGSPVSDNLAIANKALVNENAELRRQLTAYQHNYRRLREWADKVEPMLERLKTKQD